MPLSHATSVSAGGESAVPFPRGLNRAVLGVVLVGGTVAAYLTLAHLNMLLLSCNSPLFDCGRVAAHPLAHGLGIPALRAIPTAVFGVLFFAALGGLTLLRPLAGASAFGRLIGRLRFALAFLGLGVFALLTYAEKFLIRAWCPYCIVAALCTVVITALLLGTRAYERAPSRARGEAGGLLVLGVIGVAVGVGALWTLKRIEPKPQPVPQLTRATLDLAACRVFGPASAPATLVEFGSYQCRHCKEARPRVEALPGRYPGRLNVVFSPASVDPDADFLLLSRAAEAAGRQGRYAEMHRALYARQDAIRDLEFDKHPIDAVVRAAAQAAGVDPAAFARNLADPAVARQVAGRIAIAQRYRITGLPKFVFLTPTHPAMLLHTIDQAEAWLQDPAHW